MREVQSSEAKARLTQLLSEAKQRTNDGERTMEQIDVFRKCMPSIAVSEILAARHEGHRC